MCNNFTGFQRFDAGTKCKLASECGLGRRNIQFPVILGLSSKSKHFDPIVVAD
jgi:hypothetical protein